MDKVILFYAQIVALILFVTITIMMAQVRLFAHIFQTKN